MTSNMMFFYPRRGGDMHEACGAPLETADCTKNAVTPIAGSSGSVLVQLCSVLVLQRIFSFVDSCST